MTIHKFIFTACVLFYSHAAFSQSQVLQDMESNKIYYQKFNSGQIKIIKNYWQQYFVRDIYPDLLSEPLNYYPLFMDSYGGLYPNQPFYPDNFDFTSSSNYDVNLLRYSHFQNIRYHPELKSRLADQSFASRIHFEKRPSKSKASQDDLDQFYDNWNGHFIQKAIDSIQQKMAGKKHIIFFIHGYNVPYSLAVVQSLNILNKLKDKGLTLENTLLIPVFWSSNNQKHKQVDPNANEPFDVQDEKDLANFKKWTYYSTRAYYAAITLRKILSGINSKNIRDKDVMIIAHSLGTTIATTACINTTSKLDDGPISDILRTKLTGPVPAYPIKLFLSAPAIPGGYTFMDMDSDFSNKIVFSTVNVNDRMVTKFKLLASKFSSTTLGCNYKGEADSTKLLFDQRGFIDQFVFSTVSDRQDHDIFTYMRQTKYTDFLGRFLNTPQSTR